MKESVCMKHTHLFVCQELENIQEDMEKHFNNWVV